MSAPVDPYGSSDEQLRRLYEGNPIIDRAEGAIRAFRVETRADAARALELWAHVGELTDRERAAVLARFTRAGEP